MDEIIAKIKEYLKIINTTIDEKDDALIEFVICEVIDRVQLYLNSEVMPVKTKRIIAQIVNTNLTKVLNNMNNSENNEPDQVITSISDNGQSISYANEVRKYFTTASDEEIFSGFTDLLRRYRRIKVVHPSNNEEQDS